MNKKLFKSLTLTALFTLLVSTIVSLLVYYNFFKTNTQRELGNTINIVKISMEKEKDKIGYLEKVSKDKNVRISYFTKEGVALFDSFKDLTTLDNHFDREEIQGAKKFGKYSLQRFSKTLSTKTYYVAMKLEDDSILRLSREVDSIYGTFVKVFPLEILLALVIFIISIYISKRVTNKILYPLNNFKGDIDSLDLNEIPEIEKFISEIKRQREVNQKNILEIQKERDIVNAILNNMREGIILLDKNKNLLVANPPALKILGIEKIYEGKNILYTSRNEDLLKGLDDSLQDKNSEGEFDLYNRQIKYYISSIYEKEEISGTVVLLIDETRRFEIEKLKTEFSANVSHELKTPLTSIYGFSELLKNNLVDEKDKGEIIEHIYEQSKRLLSLIEDIIEISKLENIKEFPKEEVSLLNITKESIKSLEKEIEDKNISVNVIGDANIIANPTMIWEMVKNLIENSIKYNRLGGKIDISIEENKDKTIFKIKDTGIGIAKKDLDRIFERFYRSEKSRNKKYGGSGLGLSIVKHVAKNHNAEIEIESELNKGTSVKIIFQG